MICLVLLAEFGGKGERQENTKYLITVAWHKTGSTKLGNYQIRKIAEHFNRGPAVIIRT
jgi:hypothetical protein